jgi:asparagine synthase (glutamine-hydrolysing)
MCGIVGAYRPLGRGTATPDIIERMRDRMTHRGPDSAGLWGSPDGRCLFGHRRLSIIDLSSAADQPMVNDEGSVALIFNGEIYNHMEIRQELEALGERDWKTDHSDTEVALRAYQRWGVDCVERFSGMFALALYDMRDQDRPILHLVRDRIGVKPLYVTRSRAGEWLFGSEIRALIEHPDVSAEMDPTAFWHYLTFIVAPAPLTMFKGIFKISAGHRVTIDHTGRARAEQYWDCRPDRLKRLTEDDLSEEEATEELVRLLRQSIARRMVSDVPFGVLLSGGVDSSLNVALMSELMERPVRTFTIGYEGKDSYNEFHHAQKISRQFNTDHHEMMIDGKQMQDFLPLLIELQDEPIADNVCIPLYFVAQLVKESGTTVVQVGEGADENFLGYWWCEYYRDRYEKLYRPARDSGRRVGMLGKLLSRATSRLRGRTDEDAEIEKRARTGQELFWGGAVCWRGPMRDRLTPDPAPFAGEIDCPIEGMLPEGHRSLDSHAVVGHHLAPLNGSLPEPDVIQKIPYMELKLRLPEHLLMRVDKMTMAHSVEARVPFLDHDLVEFAMRLPPSYKLRNGVGKWLLKRVGEKWLDNDILYRRKQGFGAPMAEWFQEGDFGQRCLASFERSEIKKAGYLDNDYFTGLLKQQVSRGGGYSFYLWTVMNAIIWHESWVAGRTDCF